MKVGLIDYGAGNLFSVNHALNYLGHDVEVIENWKEWPKDLAVAILPGVGTYSKGMEGLEIRGLSDEIRKFAASGGPMLGICLGAQLLLSHGTECGLTTGLGLIDGNVECIHSHPPTRMNTGWRRVAWSEKSPFQQRSDWLYFVHSFEMKPTNSSEILATADCGTFSCVAAVGRDSIIGTQFHPEKSGELGCRLLGKLLSFISE